MNYFEFYDIPLTFQPDQVLVKKKFYSLSKSFHPDFFVNESEEKQAEILQLSTLNNKAFQTLSQPDKLLAYILSLKGELVEGEKYGLPQTFLMEMMEVNEALMELEFDADEEQLKILTQTVADLENDLNTELEVLTTGFELQNEEVQQQLLPQIKDIWYRKKYMLRIRESINKFATR
jgi:molecular chaperone HscB